MKFSLFPILLLLIFTNLNAQIDQITSTKFENFGTISETFINGGNCYKTQLFDSLLYVGCSTGLLIYNISDSSTTELIGVHQSISVSALYFKDNLLYLGAKRNSKGLIEIINIEDPTQPELIFSLELPNYESNWARNIIVKGDFIYVSYSHLYMIDMTDWNNPIIYQDWSIQPKDFEIRNELLYELYVAHFNIYDIVQDTSFVLRSSIVESGLNNSIYLEGDIAYVTGSEMRIIDVNDPDYPEIISQITFSVGSVRDINITNSKAYVTGISNNNGLFAIVDVQNPENPEVISEYNDYLGNYISVDENIVCISSNVYNGIGFSGLITLDVEDPANVYIQNYIYSSTAEKCRIENNMAFFANNYSGFSIFDITNCFNPVYLSSVPTKWKAVDVLVDASILYVAEADSGIQIFDIADPEQPQYLSSHCSLNSWDGYLKLEKYLNYLYTGGACWINDIIDVSDPQNPIYIGTVPVNDWGYDIQIMDGHLFVAGYWGGFQIFSLENPANPVEVGYYPLGLALKVAVSKDLGYIYDSDVILIFDISNYTSPILTYSYNPGQFVSVYNMYAQGDTLYYSDGLSRINVLDVSNPYNPFIVDSITDIRALSFDFYNQNFITHDEYYMKIIGDTTVVSINESQDLINNKFLLQNSPNPFSEFTNITFTIPETSHIKLEIYDNAGKKLHTLIDRNFNIGDHIFKYNATSLKQGIYYYKLVIDGKFSETKKMLVIN